MANLLSSSPQNSNNYSQQSSVDHEDVPSAETEPDFGGAETPQAEQSIGHSRDSLSISASMSPALSFLSQSRHPEGNNPVLTNAAPSPSSSTPPYQLTPPTSSQSQASILQIELSLQQCHSTPAADNVDCSTSHQFQHGLSVSVTESALGGENEGLSPPGRIGTAASYPCLTSAAITVPSIGSNGNKSWSGNIRSSPILASESGHSPQSNASPNLSSRSRSQTPDLLGHHVLTVQNSGNGSHTPSPTEIHDLVAIRERFPSEGLSVSPEFVDCQSELNPDNLSRSSESGKSSELQAGRDSSSGKEKDKERKESRGSSDKERTKRKSTWYNALNPTYKSRMEDFKRIFKDLPADERLIVDYSCALQRDILLQGRIYVTQNFICFYANIFRWETIVQLRWKDVTSLTKEKTALVIPNAIQLTVENDKYFFTSFGARDKTYVVLFRTWQKALLDKPLTNSELLQFVQSVYGIELGFSSGDDDELLNSLANSTTNNTTDIENDRRKSDVTDSPPLAYKLPTPVSVSFGLHSSPTFNTEGDLGDEVTAASPSVAIPSSHGLEDHLHLAQHSPPTDNTRMDTASPNTNGSWNEQNALNGFSGSTSHLETNGGRMPGGRKEKLSSKDESNLPTDLSDTTDEESEDHDEPPVQCPEAHDGRELVSFVVPFSVDQVFNMYFTNNSFYHEFQANRKSTDVVVAPWQPASETGEKKRQLTYTVNLNSSLAVKSCRSTEIQTMLACSRPGQMYSVNAEVTNAGIPYADTFAAMLHYCVLRIGPKESRLVLWANIKYKKSVWGLVKTFIEKNTYSGLEEFADQLKRAFLNAVPTHHEERRSSISRPEREFNVKMRHTRPQAARRRRPNVLCKLDTNEPSTVTAGVPGERSAKGVALMNYTQQIDSFRPTSTLSDKAVKLVLATLAVLFVINGLLFWRLWTLESFAQETMSPGASLSIPEMVLKAKPQTAEDWLAVLRHQEALHKVELEKWRQVLAAATGLLRQTEDSLAILKQDVDVDKASSALIQRLKNLVSIDGVEELESPLGTREEITGASTRPREGGEDLPGLGPPGQMATPAVDF